MLEGEIRDIDLVARLIDLWGERFTGALRFENDGIIKIIYFKGGDVLSASTNDRADSVDEILMRAGKASREHVKQALTRRKETETLGDTLLNLGFITRKELTWARRVQVVGVIRSISEWEAGSFTIVADYLPKRDEGTIFPLPQIIVEMVVTDQDRQKFERVLESGSAVFAKGPAFEESFRGLGLNEEAEAVVQQVDGTRTAAEIAAASRQETFNTYKLLHALSLLGLLTRSGGATAPEPIDRGNFAAVGVADAADAWTGEMPKFDLGEAGAETSPLRSASAPMFAPAVSEPAWEVAPSVAPPAMPPTFDLAPEPAAQPQWGLDEAQIKAERKTPIATPASASVPATRDYSLSGTATRRPVAPKTLPKKRSHFGLLVTLMTLFILAGIGYFAFNWWNGRDAAPAAVVRRPVRHLPTTRASGTAAFPNHAAPPKTAGPPIVAPSTTSAPATASAPPPTATSTFSTRAPAVVPPVTVAKAAPKKPAPAPPPAATNPGDRYASMAREFAAAPAGKFTVQFEIVCDPSNITKALRAGGSSVWFVPISLKGRACYRVFWGHYETRAAAERGMREIPAGLREATPSVVAVPQS